MKVVLLGIAAITAVLVTHTIWPESPPWDDTDSPTRRSGMGIYTDNRTGCQYLGRYQLGLTPRLDAEGKIICKK